MIDFTRAFETAWERMQVILFRPFDPVKWLAIGFSAFLAGLIQGGNGVSSSFGPNDYKNITHPDVEVKTQNVDIHQMISQMLGHIAGVTTVAILVVVIVIAVAGIVLLMGWLGSRGQFMLLDNIVRNRGAIVWPWQTYARQANSFFLFYLLFVLVSFVIIVPILAVAIVMCIPIYQQNRWPNPGETAGFIGLGIIYFLVSIVVTVAWFLFREFGVPIMFRRGLTVYPALAETWNVVRRNPGSVAVFILLRLVLLVGLAIVSAILCCATCCCCAQIPYVGTVLLLPALLFIKCFTLDCLAQFGPEYDVWTVDVPPVPLSPPLPPG